MASDLAAPRRAARPLFAAAVDGSVDGVAVSRSRKDSWYRPKAWR
ncbi:hypothetical protein OV203_50475 [Nannocystis sp. ILAH1]|nr:MULTISPECIES: hypothetical protein [unclassified Nannocystis]MCY0986548.1 hypothetical protein [Nannocystis sp. ILAH1]MCY0995453.1 hypothetical protein [Nannocystis sp. ILAH1]MCY1071428.1 hypothetical protein [Nannocystis sp. RBIL2]